MKKWIIALVLILAVVIVFVACKGNEKEETPSQTPTQSTEPASNDESDSETKKTEIILDDLNDDFNDIQGTFDDLENTDKGNIIYFGDGENVTGEPTIGWDNF